MSDAVVEAATAAVTGTPATDTSSTPAADPTSADSSLGAAQAAYKAAIAAQAAPETEAAAEVPAATAEKPAEPAKDPAKELEAGGDEKLGRVFNRISRLEDELKAAKGETDTLKQRAARADELEAEKQLFLSDPEKFFTNYGWDKETIRDYIVNGPSAVKPEAAKVRKETQTLKQEMEALKAELRAKDEAGQVQQAKARIPAALAPDKAKFPTLHAYYDQPAEMADAIYGVINATYQQQKTVLTVHEAAEAVEKVLAEQAKRFSRASSKEPEPSTKQPATKQPSPTLTNVPPSSSNPPIPQEESQDDDHFEEALAVMRQFKKK